MNKPKMFLLCGVSGSGKTTWSKEFAKSKGYVLLNVDDFYKAFNGDDKIHENVFDVWMCVFRAIHDLEKAGKDCIIDTNALTENDRNQMIWWFPGFEHNLIWIDTDFDLCYKNNCSRDRIVPKDRFDEMCARFESPVVDSTQPWHSIIRIKNINNQFQKIEILKGEYSI